MIIPLSSGCAELDDFFLKLSFKMLSVEQAEKDEVAPKQEIYSESLLLPGQVQTEIADGIADLYEVCLASLFISSIFQSGNYLMTT